MLSESSSASTASGVGGGFQTFRPSTSETPCPELSVSMFPQLSSATIGATGGGLGSDDYKIGNQELNILDKPEGSNVQVSQL